MGMGHADFMEIFDRWAGTYDQTVYASVPADGFENYAQVLERVATLAGAGPGVSLLDVGTGTGNLAQALVDLGAKVTAVEPSEEMRRVAQAKLGQTPVLAGQFLALPVDAGTQDGVVSTYAFHHLNDATKELAAAELLRVLRPGGRVVIGDYAWADAAAKDRMVDRFRTERRLDLVQEIQDEYYPTVGLLTTLFASRGCSVYVEQINEWVWIMMAQKGRR